jgi:DNA-binding Xre family transcriptional regulator/quercetin dioxygenase-like cupin family protein
MKQEDDVETVVRQRIRGLRVARGWSLDELATRCLLSPSTLSRIETGHRRISLDQLTAIARALGTSLDALVESGQSDVVIRPRHDPERGMTTWTLRHDAGPGGTTVAKMRIERPVPGPDQLKAHPGFEWFTVLSGTIALLLNERLILVETGEAAEFDTMLPHAFGAQGGPAEILGIFDPDGRRTHLRQLD